MCLFVFSACRVLVGHTYQKNQTRTRHTHQTQTNVFGLCAPTQKQQPQQQRTVPSSLSYRDMPTAWIGRVPSLPSGRFWNVRRMRAGMKPPPPKGGGACVFAQGERGGWRQRRLEAAAAKKTTTTTRQHGTRTDRDDERGLKLPKHVAVAHAGADELPR